MSEWFFKSEAFSFFLCAYEHNHNTYIYATWQSRVTKEFIKYIPA